MKCGLQKLLQKCDLKKNIYPICVLLSLLFCNQFLERCTSMLNLPFAARRLFDETGREHRNLSELTRDQVVYVTCGETWTDPSVSKAEQQRRFLLSNLAADVAQIRQYVALKNPQGKNGGCIFVNIKFLKMYIVLLRIKRTLNEF